MAELHFRIGHENIQAREHEPCQGKRNQPDQEFAQGGQQGIVLHMLQGGAHIDGETAGHHQQQGNEQQHRRVVRDFAVHAPGFFHLPDAVEGDFQTVHQVQHRPKQQDEAHADEYAAFGFRQVGIDELQDDVHRFRLSAKGRHDLFPDDVVETESPRNGKDNGQNGDDGQQRAVGQCRSLVDQPVLREAVDAEVDALDDVVGGESSLCDLILRDAPDVVGQEFPKGSDTLVHFSEEL